MAINILIELDIQKVLIELIVLLKISKRSFIILIQIKKNNILIFKIHFLDILIHKKVKLLIWAG